MERMGRPCRQYLAETTTKEAQQEHACGSSCRRKLRTRFRLGSTYLGRGKSRCSGVMSSGWTNDYLCGFMLSRGYCEDTGTGIWGRAILGCNRPCIYVCSVFQAAGSVRVVRYTRFSPSTRLAAAQTVHTPRGKIRGSLVRLRLA